MTITWTLAPGATQHVVDGSYNDGSAHFTVTSPTSPVSRPMPYHASGAATAGWVCVAATVNNATIPQACNSYTVPAKPVTPPPSSTEVFITFLEPSKNTDGTTLTDLGTIRAYWRIDGGPESMVVVPASGPMGGLTMTHSLIIPANSGTLTVQVSSVNLSGQESLQRSNTATKPLGPPAKGTIRVNTITQ
jgi:hypothetical protein